jgi:tripartite-type tricarboxylate transporter receptor subunit TctC
MKLKMRLLAAGMVAALCSTAAMAQQFPNKAVRLVVGFPPGGLADIAARIMADKLTGVWGQQVIVDNRGGASGAIAADLIAHSAPDGYNLLVILTNHVILPVVQPKLTFDPVADFAPVSLMGSAPVLLMANPKLPVKTMADLIALAKSKPGTLTYSTPGDGSVHHLAQELLDSGLGIKMIHVPYKGGSPAMMDAIAGVVDLTVGSPAQSLQQVQGGKLRALSISSPKRSPLLPDVPTLSETVAPGFTAGLWVGVLAPRDTPKPIVDKINADITRILRTPEINKRMIELGVDVVASTPEQMGTYMGAEMKRWGDVARAAGVKSE